MEDPKNPLSGSLPLPPSPHEDWASVAGEQHIKHLNNDNFDHFIKDKETFVMFYALCKLVIFIEIGKYKLKYIKEILFL